MLDEKGTDDAEGSRKVVNGRKVAGAIKSLVNVKGLSLECATVLHEGMLSPVLMYSCETMVWNKRYRSKVQCVPVSYTHLRAHETPEHLVCRLLLEKKKKH